MRTHVIAMMVFSAACSPDDEIVDQDADGFTADEDCDDDDAAIHPGVPEIWYDGVDQGCAEVDPPLEFTRIPDSSRGEDPGGPRFAREDDVVEVNLVFANEGVVNKSARLVATLDGSTGSLGGSSYDLLDPTYGADFTLGRALDAARRDATSLLAVSVLEVGAPGPAAALLRFRPDGSWSWVGWRPGGPDEHFDDAAIHDDGETVHVVACGSAIGMQWIAGTLSDFDGETYVEASTGARAHSCEVIGSEVRALDEDGTVTAYTVVDDGLVDGETWEDVTDLAWDVDVFLLVRDDGLTLEIDGEETDVPTSVTPARARSDLSPDGTLFVVYADGDGDLYLLYGAPGAALTESFLGAGLAGSDLDVEVSEGALFVAARTKDDAWVAGVERRDR